MVPDASRPRGGDLLSRRGRRSGKDVTVVLHPLTDDRRILPIDRTSEELQAAPGFMLVASYNPGYQNILKTLKPSTRQRFVALDFTFPRPEHEVPVVMRESGLRRIA